MIDLRALPLVLAAFLSALLAIFFPNPAWFWLWLTAGIAALLLWRFSSLGLAFGLWPWLAGAALVGAAIVGATVLDQARRQPEIAERLANSTALTRMVVEVESQPRVSKSFDEPSWSFRVRIRALDDRAGLDSPGWLRVPVPDRPYPITARLAFYGSIKKAPPARGYAYYLSAKSKPEIIQSPTGVVAVAAVLRERFLDNSLTLPAPGGELLPGLAVGDVSRVSPELDAAMKNSSLAHLTAVSGANCALVVGIIGRVAARIGLGRQWRVILAGLGLILFVILVTPEPSVLRASAMALAILAGVFSGRPTLGWPILSLAILVLLLWNPYLAVDFGFLLSVFATAGILFLAPSLISRLGFLGPFRELLAVPLAAQIACQPVLILINPQIPLLGVAANMAADFAVAPATILGLLAALLAFIPEAAAILLWLGWLPASWIGSVAQYVNSLPFNLLAWPGGVLGALVCAVISALGLGIFFRLKKPERSLVEKSS